jgi:hypothetical protein
MAFTAAELNRIVVITGVDIIRLKEVLNFYTVYITAQTETDVRTELARWDVSGSKFVELHPTDSNKGVKTSSSDVKMDIKHNIASLLFLTEFVQGTISQGRLYRA